MNLTRPELTVPQRIASYMTIAVAVVGLILGYFVRQNVINATEVFQNKEFGITVRYPARWLVTQNAGNPSLRVVLHVQDPKAIPFKTSLQVALVPIGADATVTDLLNTLNLSRGDRYSTYQPLASVPLQLPNGTEGTELTYAYAFAGTNQFEQSVPIVIRGADAVIARGSQAIVVTYEATDQDFERDRHYFDAFLRSLEF